MEKSYKNKQIKESSNKELKSYFFPKANPPITIEAESLEEAEKKLSIIKNKNHE